MMRLFSSWSAWILCALVVAASGCSSGDDVRTFTFDGVFEGDAVSFVIADGIVRDFTVDLSCEFEPGQTSRAQGEVALTTIVNFKGEFRVRDASIPLHIEGTVIDDDPVTGWRVDGTFDYLTCTGIPWRSYRVDPGP